MYTKMASKSPKCNGRRGSAQAAFQTAKKMLNTCNCINRKPVANLMKFQRRSESLINTKVMAGIKTKFHTPKVTDADNSTGNRNTSADTRTCGTKGAKAHNPCRSVMILQLHKVKLTQAMELNVDSV